MAKKQLGENPKDRMGALKVPLALVPPAVLIYAALAFSEGARKYGAYNWRTKRVRKTVYIEAAMRHLQALLDGEDLDPDSRYPHEAKVIACMGILLDAKANGTEIDDRPRPGPGPLLLKQFTRTPPKGRKKRAAAR